MLSEGKISEFQGCQWCSYPEVSPFPS
ncbi:hypothetical protein LEMLEM_LOCUS7254 [Lemmus lemmus]